MAIDFPNSPATNDTFSSNGKTFVWTGTRWDLQSYTAQKGAFYANDVAPGSPLVGDVWYDTSVGKTYMRYDGYWVEVGNSGTVQSNHGSQHINGGTDAIDGDRLQIDYVPTVYTRNSAASGATLATDLTAHLDGVNTHLKRVQAGSSAPSSPSTGWLWYDTNVSTLKVYNGSAWVYSVPSGSVVQTVTMRYGAQTSYSANSTGNGTTVTAANIAIAPRFSTSKIICFWSLNAENQSNDGVFLIHKDGALQTDSYNDSQGNNRWSGIVPFGYDTDNNSTTNQYPILYVDTAGSTSARTYAPAVRSANSSNWTFYLNRTYGSAGQDNYEAGLTYGYAMEIAA